MWCGAGEPESEGGKRSGGSAAPIGSGMAWSIAPALDAQAIKDRLQLAESLRVSPGNARNGVQVMPVFVRIASSRNDIPMQYPLLPEMPAESFVRGIEDLVPMGHDQLGLLGMAGETLDGGR